MKFLIFVLAICIPANSFATGRYEKRKAGEVVSFDAMCLDIEAMATIASEHEKVKQQCLLEKDKIREEHAAKQEALKASFVVELKKKDEIIMILSKPTPPKPRSIMPYFVVGGGGLVVGAASVLILFLVK